MGRMQSEPSLNRQRQAREPRTGRVPLHRHKLHTRRSSHTDTYQVRGCTRSTCRNDYSCNNDHYARLLGKVAINPRTVLYQEQLGLDVPAPWHLPHSPGVAAQPKKVLFLLRGPRR